MIVFINGRFVPEAEATVSVFDRSFLYGDGLFETLRVSNGKPFRWAQHLDRLERGAAFLGIRIPFAADALAAFASELIVRNDIREALLRLTLSRGVGVRGYSPRGADRPVLVMSLHPAGGPPADAPLRWRARTASMRLPAGDALAQFKTCNKLAQVLARAEAEAAGADEALLVNTDGFVVEAASSNLFWVQAGKVYTPPLADGILRGITREVVRELCDSLGQPLLEGDLRPIELRQVDAAFLTLSTTGIVELAEIDGAPLGTSPVVAKLFAAYNALVRTECS